MRRPRIALWIKWNCRVRSPYVVWVDGNMRSLVVPRWLWCWAVRRVDRWHDSFSIEPGEFKVTETLVFWIDPRYR